MNELTARCIKLDTYRDIGRILKTRTQTIGNRQQTWQLGAICDYEKNDG